MPYRSLKALLVEKHANFLLLAGVLILVLSIKPNILGDGEARFQFVQSLASGTPVPSIKYSIVQPILSTPLAYFGSYFGTDLRTAVSYFNVVVLLVLGQYIYRKISEIEDSEFAAQFCIFTLAASMLHVHLTSYYGEVLTAFALVSGFLALGRSSLVAVLLIAIGVANTPAVGGAVLLSLVGLRKFYKTILLGLMLAAGIFFAETLYKMGGVFNSSYFASSEAGIKTILPYSGLPGFSYPLFFGVLSILTSFGKGIVFFIPALVLACKWPFPSFSRLEHSPSIGILCFSVGLVLVYSKWWAWYGGVYWGPRFFLVLIFPASYLFIALLQSSISLQRSILLMVIVVYSVWIGVSNVAFTQYAVDPICLENNYKLEFVCWYLPEYNAVWRPFVVNSFGELKKQVFSHPSLYFVIWQIMVCVYFLNRLWRSRVATSQA